MKKYRFLFLISLIVLSVSTITGTITGHAFSSPSIADENEDIIESSQEDSIALARIDSITSIASESYSKLRHLMYDDVNKSEIYEAAYQCFLDNVAALEANEKGSIGRRTCRSRLIDINPLLEEGAFYYSSANNSEMLTKLAQAYVDTQLIDDLSDADFKKGQSYPSIVYIAAAGAYNAGDYQRALKYFREYLNTGEESRREQIYMFLGQACINLGEYNTGTSALVNAVELYPTNNQLVLLAIQSCLKSSQLTHLQKLLDRALMLNPNDEHLLTLQGAYYQREHEFQKALNIYSKLYSMNPQSMSVAKETAICYYNLGVLNYNKAIQQEEEKEARKYKRLSNEYFDAAIDKLREIIANNPLSVKYLKALAVCYGCIDDIPEFNKINERIMALGEAPVKTGGMPSLMAAENPEIGENNSSGTAIEVPLYSDFGKEYVTSHFMEWVQQGEYETAENYNKRVNPTTKAIEKERLNKEAQEMYLKKYSGNLLLQDLRLEKPYDATNELYQIESSYGPINVKVPLKNREAEVFKSNWSGIRLRNPKFCIKDNKVQVESVTFVTPSGKSYDSSMDLAYQKPVTIDVPDDLFTVAVSTTPTPEVPAKKIFTPSVVSDVDVNIPKSNKQNDKMVALIIANENYKNVSKVESALHDGNTFKEYCIQTLGIPEHNVLFYPDASLADMITANDYLGDLVKANDGDVDILVYYSGHGMPDEGTKEAYIVPIDGTDRGPSAWYSLNNFYKNLSELKANSTMVFIDACFSGSQRDGGALMESRGIAIKPSKSVPVGNMFILTATSDNETALPYKEKDHGMFTYYLLKKIQESKGNVSLQDLSDYVISNVKKESMRVNHKLQTPTVSSNGRISDELKNKKLKQ